MVRAKAYLLRFHPDEFAVVEAMAMAEKLPIGTFMRRLLLLEADKRGITPRKVEIENCAAEDSEAQRSAALQ